MFGHFGEPSPRRRAECTRLSPFLEWPQIAYKTSVDECASCSLNPGIGIGSQQWTEKDLVFFAPGCPSWTDQLHSSTPLLQLESDQFVLRSPWVPVSHPPCLGALGL